MSEMKSREFSLFQSLIYDRLGIALSDKKVSLLQSRLGKLVKKKGMSGYMELYEHFKSDHSGAALVELEDAITTNVTSFFREAQQWIYLKKYLREHILPKNKRKLRIWSSASSSGEEPYSIAIFLQENLPNYKAWDIKILATDLSDDILKKAVKGVYSEKDIDGVPKHVLHKYFIIKKIGETKEYTINNDAKNMITFRKFNLVYGNYAMFSNKFDIIFCRNVMIYFDKPTQTQIINHHSSLLHKDGLLLVGHSESIPPSVTTLKLAASSIYKKQ